MSARGLFLENLYLIVMPIINTDIDTLIPHRRPIRLIDALLEAEDDYAVTAATVTEQWPLFKNGAVNTMVLIELVAQTAAALNGYRQKQKNTNHQMRSGLLVAIQSANFLWSEIPLHARIITRCTTRVIMENYREVSGFSQLDEERLGDIRLHTVLLDAKK